MLGGLSCNCFVSSLMLAVTEFDLTDFSGDVGIHFAVVLSAVLFEPIPKHFGDWDSKWLLDIR